MSFCLKVNIVFKVIIEIAIVIFVKGKLMLRRWIFVFSIVVVRKDININIELDIFVVINLILMIKDKWFMLIIGCFILEIKFF